jgi:mRNA interferase ChpB
MGRYPGRGPRDAVKRGDVYMVDLDPTQGREQRGRRPVLIVSPEAFNLATRLPVIVPITNGGDFARRLGFAVTLEGTKTTGIVRCDQPRVLDLDARKGRKTESLPAAIIEEVLAKVVTIFGGV